MNTIIPLKSFNPMRLFPEIPERPGAAGRKFIEWQPVMLFVFLLAIWFPMHSWLQQIDPTAAVTDQGIWLQVILSLIVFLIILALCIWLLHLFWLKAGLPPLTSMVSHFKTLTSWQQLVFYWLSFALLLLAASTCIVAIC